MEWQTYVAFLRGVNVSGQKKVSMDALRTLCETLGFKEVKTYIQSGNIVFQSLSQEIDQLEKRVMDGIHNKFGFHVPIIVKTAGQLGEIIELNPYTKLADLTENKIYFVLLNSIPEKELIEKLKKEAFPNEEFQVVKNCIYLKCNMGYGKAKLNNNCIERKLKVTATTRNYSTMTNMLELTK